MRGRGRTPKACAKQNTSFLRFGRSAEHAKAFGVVVRCDFASPSPWRDAFGEIDMESLFHFRAAEG